MEKTDKLGSPVSMGSLVRVNHGNENPVIGAKRLFTRPAPTSVCCFPKGRLEVKLGKTGIQKHHSVFVQKRPESVGTCTLRRGHLGFFIHVMVYACIMQTRMYDELTIPKGVLFHFLPYSMYPKP